ncbi:tRNA (adenosine(37)-N6)-dimethylallyltransferase MiaA [Palleronia sp. KMU-117]|uniref:tRNA (adenosine(37)-N6)-dimethylallyltransferase MiaA n=1 Tax=Palleronia sp. KMU-117 TaxID=3434108 RepID=UPI003D711649
MTGKADILAGIAPDAPVLIAGPTASGKSDLALAIAEAQGGRVINADALQVFSDWRILTARPDDDDIVRAPHALYGHVPGDRPYSVGHWLRDAAPFLHGERPIVVGGTGLYFTALTQGLAQIPPTPPALRAEADARRAAGGIAALLAELDPESAARIDRANPMRVQRAWEVLRATGEGIARWQDRTGPPLLPLGGVTAIVLSPDRNALAARIDRRFQAMLGAGLMDEVARNAPGFAPDLPSSKAIGAADLVSCHRGEITLDEAGARLCTLTRQYAKRQRTWFRSRMAEWKWIDPGP